MAATYRLDTDAFVIDDYTRTKPFASFLPGISGLWGIPMWAFYVNRGQAIAGFGIQDKDHPIMEFLPANRAYRSVALHGFRTFLKLGPAKRPVFYEPFQTPRSDDRSSARQRMRIRMHDLMLEEDHPRFGLEVRVHYFTIPHEPFAALARTVTITNRSRKTLDLELLDGLPAIIPYGMLDRFLKRMSRTIEAWVAVHGVEQREPFFQLKVEPDDRPEVVPIQAGNFYVGCTEDDGRPRLLEPIVDPTLVFGYHDDLTVPARFLESPLRLPKRQITTDKTPCAMGYLRTSVPRGESRTLYALFGHMESRERLADALPRIMTPAFFAAKARENDTLIQQITAPIHTRSRLRAFDLYCRQTFLDNLLRGGTPVVLGDPTAPTDSPRRKLFYVFGRKHGDLERDYNDFVIPPTPFSQGDANFRDVNQNRRTDAWFHPTIGDTNILTFFSLIQPDGFNPLVVHGLRCVASAEARAIPELREILSKPFAPGELLRFIARHRVKIGEPVEAFLNRMVGTATTELDAEHGEGFWTDHWTYNLDLLESYLALYPERLRPLLLEKRTLTFYDNAYVVVPRALKYQHTSAGIRQFHAVRRDPDKANLIRSRTRQPHCVRAGRGQGEVYTTTLAVKMVCVIANKLASLDPSGIGVEMEANKPNWYDALNGLPGLLGSSVCETFELKRWLVFLDEALARLALDPSTAVVLPEELHDLLGDLRDALDRPDAEGWRLSADARERYRERIRLGFSGQERPLTVAELRTFLRQGLAKVNAGISKAFDRSRGLYAGYFYHQVSAYTTTQRSPTTVTPKRWTRHTLPVFLEGMVHALRLTRDPARARTLHQAVKKSPLYDRALRMYRVCDSLAAESLEIGRCRVFNPGWLENQSIWLHMEYKYLLELFRCGLYEEFYEELFAALIPFQPPRRYGRSILENSSFLVSSAYADPALHGNGFVARLSGATAEFLQMWLWMTVGRTPFRLNVQGALELRLSPALPSKLFDARGRFSFRFLGSTDVTYHNPLRRATFGPGGVSPGAIRLTTRSKQAVEFRDGVIPAPYAEKLRLGLVTTLEVELVPPRARGRPASTHPIGRLKA